MSLDDAVDGLAYAVYVLDTCEEAWQAESAEEALELLRGRLLDAIGEVESHDNRAGKD